MTLFYVLAVKMAFAPASDPPSPLMCIDWKGSPVADGQEFIKGDACMRCTCFKGSATMCTAVQCSPPNCPHYEEVKDACCEFICINLPLEPGHNPDTNATHPHFPGSSECSLPDLPLIMHCAFLFCCLLLAVNSSGDLGLRLIASTVTSLLILALLLFMIHRLRQRRLLIMMRR